MSEKKPESVKMRINVAGYSSEAVSLMAALGTDTDMLIVLRADPYEAGPRDDFLCVTNQSSDKHFDALCTEDDMRDSIEAFFGRDAMQLMKLMPAAERFNPSNQIERDGMDANGMKYRIGDRVTNAQVAVLMAALFANRQRSMASMTSFADEMMMMLETI